VIPPRRRLGADAVKRLEAIAAIEERSVGFTLASLDLEIRGAPGDPGRGAERVIEEIGFGLYTELLERSWQRSRRGANPSSVGRSITVPRSSCTCRY
jgi:transcription-repair coupling factor (superfamily II helicase)